MTKLTIKQQDRLDECELVITEHEQGFLAVADALSEIRDEKLWEAQYVSFEAYCQERWGWTSRRARQIIQSAETVRQIEAKIEGKTGVGQSMSKVGNAVSGLSQRAALELSRIEPEKQIEALRATIVNGETPTAPAIKEAAAAIKEAAKPKPEEPDIILDGTGCPIPEKRLAMWNRRDEVQKILTAVSNLRGTVQGLEDAKKTGVSDPLYESTDLQGTVLKLANVYQSLHEAMPYAVCPDCQGHRSETCMSCKGRAFVSKYYWDNALCDEARQLRSLSAKK